MTSRNPPPLLERLNAQLLAGPPAGDPVSVAERLLAIQGQDPRGARLAVRARSTGFSAAAIDRALTDERSLLITWVNRGTLHLMRSEDYHWLHGLTAPPQVTGNARRLAQLGVDAAAADRAVAVIERSLSADGPLTRAQIQDRLMAKRIPALGQALVHLLFLASLRGLIVRGPMAGRQHAYVLVRDWLPKPPRLDRATALAELARRYLAGHGPADDRDLARWAGLPLRDARAGLTAIGGELVERHDGLVELGARRSTAEVAPPKLLGAFEPVLLGWVSREPLLGRHTDRVTMGGIFRSFALVGGRAAATWTLDRGSLRLEPLERVAKADRAALERDAENVARFLNVWPGSSSRR